MFKTINDLLRSKPFIKKYNRYATGVNRDMRECKETILKTSHRYQYIVFEYEKKYLITNFNQNYILAQEVISGDITKGQLVLGQTLYFFRGIKFWKVHEYVMFRD